MGRIDDWGNVVMGGRRLSAGAWLGAWVLSGIFLAAFAINHFTPMISDDYAFYLMGTSWDAVKGRYMGWGGRLTADTLASAILGLDRPWVADAFNALALTALIWILAALGARLLALAQAWAPGLATPPASQAVTGASRGVDAGALALVFALYWIANPDLGQTTFWIVGAANYLWTSVFNFGFALAFVTVLQRARHPWWQALLLCMLALPAGCSNENTGIVTWVLLVWLAFSAWRRGHRSLWPWVWLFFFGIGICVLVLAPGNTVRGAGFHDWYDHSLWWRMGDHFIRRFPDAMFRYGQIFLVLGVLAVVARKRSHGVGQMGAGVQDGGAWRGVMRGMWLLIGMACLANAVLVFAPNIPKRALQGGFLYALVAVAIVAHHVLRLPGTAGSRWVKAVFVVCGVQWALSFGLMLRAYHGAYQQDQVRVSLVRQGIAQGDRHIEIPQYHFSRLLKRRDRFDLYFDGGGMARYYGAAGTEITVYPVAGPYGPGVAPVRAE